MTPEQLATLAQHIAANTDPLVVAARTIRNDNEVARIYNLPTAFIAWRKSIPASELGKTVIYNALSGMTATNTSRVDLFVKMNPESFVGTADLDSYFNDTFGGALNGSGAACRAALAAMLRRPVNLVESIFATGTGVTSDPGALVFEGTVGPSDIGQALNMAA